MGQQQENISPFEFAILRIGNCFQYLNPLNCDIIDILSNSVTIKLDDPLTFNI